jgi:tetratricopeptide (TPR) repeat protein
VTVEADAAALLNQALALAEAGDLESAVDRLTEVARRFASVPEASAVVADALFRKGIALHMLDRYEEELQAYAELAGRFAGSGEPDVRSALLRSLLNGAGRHVYHRADGEAG